MPIRIASIVEGHGEVEAVPVLLRRIGQVVAPQAAQVTPSPFRVPKSTLRLARGVITQSDPLSRAIRLVMGKVAGEGGIVLLYDADDDCPVTFAAELLRVAANEARHIPLRAVVAKREFEGWFLAAAQSLRGCIGLPRDLDPPVDPEAIRGAKEWLRQRLPAGHTSRETIDQPTLASRMDLMQARQAASFDKFYPDVESLLLSLRQ